MTSQYVDRLSRSDRDMILTLVPEGARMLDLGCGDCSLLNQLVREKQIRGTGLDIDGMQLVNGQIHGQHPVIPYLPVPLFAGDLAADMNHPFQPAGQEGDAHGQDKIDCGDGRVNFKRPKGPPLDPNRPGWIMLFFGSGSRTPFPWP